MKCFHCGYDRIQPNFNYCPSCKQPLNKKSDTVKMSQEFQPSQDPQEKTWINRVFSGWTYEKAISDPFAYAVWALKNPNDNLKFLEKWEKQGHKLDMLRHAIMEARRARQENPTVDRVDEEANIINANRQRVRQSSNVDFVEQVGNPYTSNVAAVVCNKAVWKLQPGELARHIAPDEWVYVSEHLEGVVIEEGTSAIVYVDGEEVAQMGSGMYVFDDKHATAAAEEAVLRERESGGGIFSRIRDGLYRLFTGRNRSDSARERESRQRRVQQIVGRMKRNTIIDVYLKSDRVFPAVFGQSHLSDSPTGYQPYDIQSRYLDIKVGVSMQMQIGDFKEFITNYMMARKSVTVSDVVKSVDGAVYSILRYQLRDVEITERGLDEYTYTSIKEHLKRNLPNLLHGVVVVEVLDIATTNEQLARFRQVEEQLYCSEREYDFLIRTNEFRNRLASEENDQKIREARSEQELRRCLDEVNRDGLLQNDEMEQFVSLLMNQKTIREATNSADLDRAMLEIERNRLITNEEFDIFTEDMQNKRFERNQVSEQLRARSLMATALSKLAIDRTLNIANIQNTETISEAEFEAFKKSKGREAEGWDLDAMVYGRQYVFERQRLLDEQERKRTENAFEIEEQQHKNKLGSVEIEGLRQHEEYVDERVLSAHKLGMTIDDDLYAREQGKKEDSYQYGRREKEDNYQYDHRKKEDDYQYDHREKEDDYQYDYRRKEDDLKMGEGWSRIKQQEMEAAFNRAERMGQMAMQNMQVMQEVELEKQRIEAEVAKAGIEAEKVMSADQLMSKNIATMDAEAQAKFAESFSHLNEVNLLKASAEERDKLYKEMLELAKKHGEESNDIHSENAKQQVELMKEMMKTMSSFNENSQQRQQNIMDSMLGTIQSVAGSKMQDQKELKEEYREQMKHEQSRTDENQRQSLNYTTRVKVAENMPFNTVAGTSVNVNVGKTYVCPRCGERIELEDASCCPGCGKDLK